MLNPRHFVDLVINPALETLGMHSQAAVELLLGTALQESGLRSLRQAGGGPALGLFQMEPATHDDIHLNFLAFRPDLQDKLRSLCSLFLPEALAGSLWYSAAMCRLHYYRKAEPLPAAGNIPDQASYWKRHYNTPLGKGSVTEYLANWKQHGQGVFE